MTNDQIEKFLDNHTANLNKPVKIFFRTRNTIEGVFLKTSDYNELKSKNFWRIITGTNLENFKKTNDMSLARMFNGAEFTRLSAN